ncbi:flagellar assembly peptidoglycan hydrolase FlgJ [Methylomonas sp. AM2-LC]|uniref:flagellar assembly peptidoglycan hydrolase FlgJ n=1 Tax=Methylomonas sp. AM2-LC TaxID=3153301 RepID=UPI0032637649
MLSLDSTPVYTDFDGLAKLKLDAREQSPEAIKQVANQFESVFLNMMLKSMRQAKLGDGIMDNQQSDFYQDMYDQQLATQLAGKPGLGIAEFILKQLNPKTGRADKKRDAEDYLSQADNIISSSIASTQSPAVNMSSTNPINLSGLNSLERSLSGVYANRQNRFNNWQSQDDEWQTQKLDDSQAISNKQDFINQLLPHAQQAANALGVDVNLLLAQAALETGWGQAVIKNGLGESSFNLFNIKADKAWQGKQTKALTVEFNDGIAKKEMAGFRSYNSYKESFNDYVNFIKTNPRYNEALKKAANAQHYIHELQQAGYATDPKYAEKVMNIFNTQTASPKQAKIAG